MQSLLEMRKLAWTVAFPAGPHETFAFPLPEAFMGLVVLASALHAASQLLSNLQKQQC